MRIIGKDGIIISGGNNDFDIREDRADMDDFRSELRFCHCLIVAVQEKDERFVCLFAEKPVQFLFASAVDQQHLAKHFED